MLSYGWMAQPDICLAQPDIWWVAHVILVSAQVLLISTLGLRTLDFGLGLDNLKRILHIHNSFS